MYKSQHRNASRVVVGVCTRLYHNYGNKQNIRFTVLDFYIFVALNFTVLLLGGNVCSSMCKYISSSP